MPLSAAPFAGGLCWLCPNYGGFYLTSDNNNNKNNENKDGAGLYGRVKAPSAGPQTKKRPAAKPSQEKPADQVLGGGTVSQARAQGEQSTRTGTATAAASGAPQRGRSPRAKQPSQQLTPRTAAQKPVSRPADVPQQSRAGRPSAARRPAVSCRRRRPRPRCRLRPRRSANRSSAAERRKIRR